MLSNDYNKNTSNNNTIQTHQLQMVGSHVSIMW